MIDLYRILGVPPSATQQEIKKAFRKLAMQYHPDKNPGALAQSRFLEIQRAYETLSHPSARRQYDEQRYYQGMTSTVEEVAVTPDWLLGICRKLRDSLAAMDTHRMSHNALKNYMLLILSEAHINLLNEERDNTKREEVVNILLGAVTLLDATYLPEIFTQLNKLNNSQQMQVKLKESLRSREIASAYNRFFPYLIMAVTLILCLLMYWYSG